MTSLALIAWLFDTVARAKWIARSPRTIRPFASWFSNSRCQTAQPSRADARPVARSSELDPRHVLLSNCQTSTLSSERGPITDCGRPAIETRLKVFAPNSPERQSRPIRSGCGKRDSKHAAPRLRSSAKSFSRVPLARVDIRRSAPRSFTVFVPSSGPATSAWAVFGRYSCRRSTSRVRARSPFRYFPSKPRGSGNRPGGSLWAGRGDGGRSCRPAHLADRFRQGEDRRTSLGEDLAELVAEATRGLGVNEPVAADFYKLLVYDPGSFFVDHRDTEKVPGMFASMVRVLPSTHGGGELTYGISVGRWCSTSTRRNRR